MSVCGDAREGGGGQPNLRSHGTGVQGAAGLVVVAIAEPVVGTGLPPRMTSQLEDSDGQVREANRVLVCGAGWHSRKLGAGG